MSRQWHPTIVRPTLPVQQPVQQMHPVQQAAPPSRSYVKCALVSAAVFLLLVLTVTAVGLLISNLAPDYTPEARLAELNSVSSNIHILYFRFQTGTELQLTERHPALGGFNGLNITNILDYSICCNTHNHQFICMGGGLLAHGNALEALLQEENDEVFLLLWLNSRDVIEVGCIMRASVLE